MTISVTIEHPSNMKETLENVEQNGNSADCQKPTSEGATVITLDGEYASLSEFSEDRFPMPHPSDPELSGTDVTLKGSIEISSLPPTPPPVRPKPQYPKPSISTDQGQGSRRSEKQRSLRRTPFPSNELYGNGRFMIYNPPEYNPPSAFPVFHTWSMNDFSNLRLNASNRLQSEASQSICENIFDGSEVSGATSSARNRAPSPFYNMPRDERLLKSGSETESKDNGTAFRTPRRPLSRNPLYSSMPKLNSSSQSNEWKDKNHYQNGPGPRPAVSWSHLGPSSYQNANYAAQSSTFGYQQPNMQQHDPGMRNIFPYTTLYARRAPVKFPTMTAVPPHFQQMTPSQQMSFRRLPSSYKRYFSQSTRRSRSGMDSTKMSMNRKRQPRIYEIFQDDTPIESSFSTAIPMPTGPAPQTPVFFVPTPMSAPQMTPAAPINPELWGARDTASNYNGSEVTNRRKSAGKNCMIGWMLAVTALIILALAIALFIQVSKDANELNQLRSAVAADLGLEENPNEFAFTPHN